MVILAASKGIDARLSVLLLQVIGQLMLSSAIAAMAVVISASLVPSLAGSEAHALAAAVARGLSNSICGCAASPGMYFGAGDCIWVRSEWFAVSCALTCMALGRERESVSGHASCLVQAPHVDSSFPDLALRPQCLCLALFSCCSSCATDPISLLLLQV